MTGKPDNGHRGKPLPQNPTKHPSQQPAPKTPFRDNPWRTHPKKDK